MQRIFSAIFDIELSTWGKLFNTKAIISFRKEYEREEDKKVPVYSKNKKFEQHSKGPGQNSFVQEATYEMMDEQVMEVSGDSDSGYFKQVNFKVSPNKHLNTYLQIQQTSYPVRGNTFDFRV